MKKTILMIGAMFIFAGCSMFDKEYVYINTKINVPASLMKNEAIPKTPNNKTDEEVSKYLLSLYKKLKKQNKRNYLIKNIVLKYNEDIEKKELETFDKLN